MIRIVGAEKSSQETKSWCCFPQPQKNSKLSDKGPALICGQDSKHGGL